jgi:hypothetical protein
MSNGTTPRAAKRQKRFADSFLDTEFEEGRRKLKEDSQFIYNYGQEQVQSILGDKATKNDLGQRVAAPTATGAVSKDDIREQSLNADGTFLGEKSGSGRAGLGFMEERSGFFGEEPQGIGGAGIGGGGLGSGFVKASATEKEEEKQGLGSGFFSLGTGFVKAKETK